MKRKILAPYIDMVEITLIIVVSISIIQPVLYYLMGKYFLVSMLTEIVGILIIFSLITLLTASGIFAVDKLKRFINFYWTRQIIEVALVALLCYGLLRYIYFLLVPAPEPATFKIFIGINLLGSAFIYVFQKGLFLKHKAAEKAREAELLQKNYAQYRLHALKNQVNPHFLFNSLSVLSSLVHRNADLAETFVLKLSDAYTYILNQKETDLVTLDEELKFLKSYFFLLQIRFGSKISLDINVEETKGFSIPPLILQLLLENAVKHNRMSTAQPLSITIDGDGDNLIVQNNINKREKQEESSGLGLENIRQRYLMVDNSEIEVKDDDSVFSVKIPLIKDMQ
mgnify:CR=1 FL=1